MKEERRAIAADKPIRVSIIEDQREVREGLEALVNGTQGFRCAAGYRTMEDALARIGTELPDVVLTDIGLPGCLASKVSASCASAIRK